MQLNMWAWFARRLRFRGDRPSDLGVSQSLGGLGGGLVGEHLYLRVEFSRACALCPMHNEPTR